jgi:hypothetical protein
MKDLLIASGWTSFGDNLFAKGGLSLILNQAGYKVWSSQGVLIDTFYIEPTRDVEIINRKCS